MLYGIGFRSAEHAAKGVRGCCPCRRNGEIPVKFHGIWDTGASATAISRNVVESCKLQPIGYIQVDTAGGTFYRQEFYIELFLAKGEIDFASLRVTVADIKHIDILIGMDVIVQEDFSITNHTGKTMVSNRRPSQHHRDYELQRIPHGPVLYTPPSVTFPPCRICGKPKAAGTWACA